MLGPFMQLQTGIGRGQPAAVSRWSSTLCLQTNNLLYSDNAFEVLNQPIFFSASETSYSTSMIYDDKCQLGLIFWELFSSMSTLYGNEKNWLEFGVEH
jgi:hypothetical protein